MSILLAISLVEKKRFGGFKSCGPCIRGCNVLCARWRLNRKMADSVEIVYFGTCSDDDIVHWRAIKGGMSQGLLPWHTGCR